MNNTFLASPGGSTWKVATIGPVLFEEMFENVSICANWVKGQNFT